MKKYISPEVEISVFNHVNIVTTSPEFGLGNTSIGSGNSVGARERGYDDFDEDDF